MEKFEYYTLKIDLESEKIDDELDKLGEEGWELVGISPLKATEVAKILGADTFVFETILIFKRRIT